jgi:hypothetical protein
MSESDATKRPGRSGRAAGGANAEWAVARRYMSAESLAKARMTVIEGEPSEEVMPALVAAG